MALDDYAEPEIAVAVAATAAVFSPRVRHVLRRGAVYGLAGLMIAGDAVSSFAHGVAQGVQDAASPKPDGATSPAETASSSPAGGSAE